MQAVTRVNLHFTHLSWTSSSQKGPVTEGSEWKLKGQDKWVNWQRLLLASQPCRCHGGQRKVDRTTKGEWGCVEPTLKKKEDDGSPGWRVGTPRVREGQFQGCGRVLKVCSFHFLTLSGQTTDLYLLCKAQQCPSSIPWRMEVSSKLSFSLARVVSHPPQGKLSSSWKCNLTLHSLCPVLCPSFSSWELSTKTSLEQKSLLQGLLLGTWLKTVE